MKKSVYLVIAISFIFAISMSIVSASLLNGNEIGFNGQTRDNNYDELLNSLYSSGKVTTKINDKLWVPWFKTSSSCQQSDLQSGNNCNSGQSIDFTHNCMVTDEFSQVAILASMGKDQAKMDQFYNTVLAIKSTNGNIPAWRVYRNGDLIEPCRQGINGNCDTASDGTARIIIALYNGAKNYYFTDEAQKSKYLELAKTLSADFLNYEVERTCRPSIFSKPICNWLAGGSNVKRAGISSDDFAYTGYYPDATIAMLEAYANTNDISYFNAAEDFALNYLQASNWDGSTFTVPPGKSFRWVSDVHGIPRAQCTKNCNPVMWDGFDASRATAMCQANYYASQMGSSMQELDKYCAVWNNKYMTNANSAPIQYYPNGATLIYQSGYFAQGLESLHQSGANINLYKTTLNNALSHYSPITKTFDRSQCFGIYTQAFAVRSLGMGIGRDLASFSGSYETSPANQTSIQNIITPAQTTQSPPTTTQLQSTPIIQSPSSSQPFIGIGGLTSSCTYSGIDCNKKSDSTIGVCRKIVYETVYGDVQLQGCAKDNGYVEIYRQSVPSDLDFKACIGDGCVDSNWGFVKFQPLSTAESTAGASANQTPQASTIQIQALQSTVGTTSTGQSSFQSAAPTQATQQTSSVTDTPISLDTSCTYNGIDCNTKSDTSIGGCRLIVFETTNGDLQILGCKKENGYTELYMQSAPDGLNFSACLSSGCVSNANGFARFIPAANFSDSTAQNISSASSVPVGSTSNSITSLSSTTKDTSIISVNILPISISPSGIKLMDYVEDSGCRIVEHSTDYGLIDVKICQKSLNRFEMYQLTNPISASVCILNNCVGSQSSFSSFIYA